MEPSCQQASNKDKGGLVVLIITSIYGVVLANIISLEEVYTTPCPSEVYTQGMCHVGFIQTTEYSCCGTECCDATPGETCTGDCGRCVSLSVSVIGGVGDDGGFWSIQRQNCSQYSTAESCRSTYTKKFPFGVHKCFYEAESKDVVIRFHTKHRNTALAVIEFCSIIGLGLLGFIIVWCFVPNNPEDTRRSQTNEQEYERVEMGTFVASTTA